MPTNNSADSKRPNTEKNSVSRDLGEATTGIPSPAITSSYAYTPLCNCPCCDDCADVVCVNSIALSCNTSTSILIGATGRMTATVSPSNATDKSVYFYSTNTSVLSCTSAGVYTAKKAGTAKIMAVASNGVSASRTFTVQAAPTAIYVNQSYVCLRPDDTFLIVPTILPATASQSFSIYSNDTSVADVDINGTVFAKNYGRTTIVVMAAADHRIRTSVTVCVSDADCDDTSDTTDTVVVANESVTGALSVREDEATSSHSIGPNATGMVDLRNGRLKFSVTDFAWDGLIAPVTIKHLYTSALKDKFFTAGNAEGLTLKDYTTMKTGYGWRLNYMNSLEADMETVDGEDVTVYTFVDRDGNLYKLYPTDDANIFEDKTGAGVTLDTKDTTRKYVTIGTDRYWCEDGGYVWRVYDTTTADTLGNQAAVSMTYQSGARVYKVKDGNERAFTMTYKSNRLTDITAPDGSKVAYTYTKERLTQITYPRGESLLFEYDADSRIISVSLQNANEKCEYMVKYDYAGNVVTTVTEYGSDNTPGRVMAYTYGGNATKVTTKEYTESGNVENVVENTFVFDNNGELIDSYTKHGGYMQSNGLEDNFGAVETGETHSYERSALNLLLGHGFEKDADLDPWYVSCNADSETVVVKDPSNAHDGSGYLRITAVENEVGHTLHQTQLLPAGEYTFSAYVKVVSASAAENGIDPGIYIAVNGADGSGASSVKVADTGNGYLRLFATFTSTGHQNVSAAILIDGNGVYHIDSVQLEQGSAPGA